MVMLTVFQDIRQSCCKTTAAFLPMTKKACIDNYTGPTDVTDNKSFLSTVRRSI